MYTYIYIYIYPILYPIIQKLWVEFQYQTESSIEIVLIVNNI